jgi:HK97 family phage prohead protease
MREHTLAVPNHEGAGWDKPQAGWDKFYVDHPFDRKVIGAEDDAYDEGDIETNGYASTWVKDRDDEYVHPNAFTDSLPAFLNKNPLMLWQHNSDWPLGIYKKAETDRWGLKSTGLIKKVEDREPDWKHLAYHSVAKGVVRTHSIGGYFERDFDGARQWITKVHLMEVSIVSIPANPESIFEAAVKSVTGASRRPELTQRHISQMMQVLGALPMTDPMLLSMNESQRVAHYEQLAGHYTRCGKRAPEYEEWNELAKEVHSSKGLEAIRGGATKTVAFMRKVQGHAPPLDADLKRGRTLSQKNEESLRQAIGLINDVLAEVDNNGESDG